MPQLIDPREIIVLREDRQRRKIDNLESLKSSITSVGVINPIIITNLEDPVLIAGERRLIACLELELPEIPYRTLSELASADLDLVELEENVQRKNLTWQEEANAINKIHSIHKETHPNWTLGDTCEIVGTSNKTYIADAINIAGLIEEGDTHTLQAANMEQARRVLKRKRNRAVENELAALAPAKTVENVSESEAEPETSTPVSPFLNVDFIEWAQNYSGPKFNLIHCDFPYGINHGKSAQGGAEVRDAYEDSPELFRNLLDTLTDLQDNFISPSAHLIFWYHDNYREEIRHELEAAGWTIYPHALIWHKTDNTGVAADVDRRPRHIYETALFASRGDRKIIQPFADIYGAPTHKSKSLHISEKPEPVLRHFFRLCCDHLSRVLDPTCGAGSAIRVAASMGAEEVLGLELNKEYVKGAEEEFIRAQQLHEASKGITI